LSHVLFWSGSPECCQLWSHVSTLIKNVFMTWWHLLDCIDIHIDVRGGVWSINHLPEG
jgi:hypothetical protein